MDITFTTATPGQPKLSCQMSQDFAIGRPGDKLKVEDGVIYWHINNFTPKMEKYRVILALEKAFNTWQQALHPIRFETTNDWRKAQIRVSFAEGDHYEFHNGNYTLKCKTRFDGKHGVLAHAYFANPELHMDEAEDWTDQETEHGTHLLSVLIHEIGHNLNIAHSDVRGAIMYPEYTGPKTRLHPDDIAAAQTIYKEERKRACELSGIKYYVAAKKPWWERLAKRIFG